LVAAVGRVEDDRGAMVALAGDEENGEDGEDGMADGRKDGS
jgi:hypothetical protein